ncbi:MAG: L-serine ammonia-lyase [Gammaproteobacteria bacterium]|nr:L-serine ammonia-lyase [Gammaproteobacteria bacterium]
MFISVLDLFKVGIGPSSSHTMGPMQAASDFVADLPEWRAAHPDVQLVRVRCILRGSLAYTGRGHGTDRAVLLGLHGYTPKVVAGDDIDQLVARLSKQSYIAPAGTAKITFDPASDIVFDTGEPLPQHPNGMIFQLLDAQAKVVHETIRFSIGGGFISTPDDIDQLAAPLQMSSAADCPYPFDSAKSMLQMAAESGLGIAAMKRANECACRGADALAEGVQEIWLAMQGCIEQGLHTDGILPGGLELPRRAAGLYRQLETDPASATLNDWLCAYAMAVNEENAAGHRVVTAPTNGAAGVIPAVLYYHLKHAGGSPGAVEDFLLTAAAIGGLIKHRSSISGAEVGCQGEVGSAAAMAAAGLCAIRGGSPQQVENAAEIALEHHLGMTCDPVKGLVQVPCIERNGFGAIKAHTAASLALHGSGQHFMPLDNCIAAMKRTGQEMSHKYKETALGGLAVSLTEC